MRECYNLGYIDRPVDFVLSRTPLYFVFFNSKNKRNDLTRPVMGTIFLVYMDIGGPSGSGHCWKRSRGARTGQGAVMTNVPRGKW